MTTDLKSKTVVELALYFGSLHDQACNAIVAFDELARRLEEAQQKIVAQEAKDNYVGRWLSAALDDPSVCEEMKADIRLWMASDAVAIAAHDTAIKAEAKAEALEELLWSGDFGPEEAEIIKGKAAEYRAKATEAGRKE